MDSKTLKLLVYLGIGCAIPALIVAGLIYVREPQLIFCYSRECFEYFLDLYEIPLKLFLWSLTAVTIISALIQASAAIEGFRLQSRSFAHTTYETHIRQFRQFIEAALVDDSQSIEPAAVNIRKLHNFFYPNSHSSGNLADENPGLQALTAIHQQLKCFHIEMQPAPLNHTRYIQLVSSLYEKAGITSEIEDCKSAYYSEQALIELLNAVSSRWFLCGKTLLASSYPHHSIVRHG